MPSTRWEVEPPDDLADDLRMRTGRKETPDTEAVRALRDRDALDEEMREMVVEADADPGPFLTAAEVREALRG